MYFFYVYYRKNRVIIANGKKFRSAGLHELRNSTRFSWEEISTTISLMPRHIIAIIRTEENTTEY